jgi:type I restriction enzyme S subunit
MIKEYEQLKETNVFWLGDIPSHWQKIKIKRLAKVKNGKDQKEITIEEGGYPAYGTGGVIGRVSEFLYDKDTVLLGRKGTIDRPQYITEPFWVVDTAFYTEINDDVNAKFFYYLSLKIPFELLQESSAVPSMTQEKLNNVYVCKPTLNEQIKIVEFLDYRTGVIDKLIVKKESLIDLLKEKRQAVINEAVTKGLDPNAKMKDSGIEWLGEVPEGWEVAYLRHLTNKVGSGVTPKGGAEVYADEGIIFIRSQNVHFAGLRLDDVVKIDLETHQKMSGSQVEFKDVLLNITGASIGRCCLVENKDEMNVNQHVCIIRPKVGLMPEYLNIILQSEIGQIQVKLGTTGGNREGLTFEAIKDFLIPLPEMSDQLIIVEKISEALKKYESLISMHSVQIEKLKEYRQSIISEAVTGKIDLREWEPPKV